MASPDGRKDPVTAMRAYAGLPGDLRLETQMAIVCSNPAVVPGLTAAADSLRISPVFLTDVSDLVLARLFRATSVFLYPSLGEGFGLPPLEAMASGAPVVASNITSIPEVLGDAAILVPPRDPQSLAMATLSLLVNGQLRRELAARGRGRAATFSWRRTAAQTLEAYERAARVA
jgi:glycosyltransferase involved in cell wall biosynthesis